MKTKIYSIFFDLRIGTTETVLYFTEADYDQARRQIIEARMAEIGDPADYYGVDDPKVEVYDAISRLLSLGKVDEAWQAFYDYDTGIKHSEDYYYLDEHELEIPEITTLVTEEPA